jgi:hypothetical protein
MLSKLEATALGPTLKPVAAAAGFSKVILFVAELMLMGKANSGLPLKGLTTFVVGSCVKIA